MFEIEKSQDVAGELQPTVPVEVLDAISLAITEAFNHHEQGYEGNRMRRSYIDSPDALDFIANYFDEPDFRFGVPVTAYVQGQRLRLAINSWDLFIVDPLTGEIETDPVDGHPLFSDTNPDNNPPSRVEYISLEQARSLIAQTPQIEE